MHRHFILFKPYGYISQFITPHKKKKVLGDLFDFPEGTMAIGRLDEDSEGLLLLTTDGVVSEKIRSKNIDKEYYVQVDGIITEEALNKLKAGVLINIKGEMYQTLPCKTARIEPPELPERKRKIRDERHGPTSWISILVNEGKFRQIRKMTAAVGFPTLRLVRYRVGNITIDGFDNGEVKEVSSYF